MFNQETAVRTVNINDCELFIDTEGEPLIHDLELAKQLGYARPRKIRELIIRLNEDENLNDFDVRPTVGRRQVGAVEREVEEFYLTEEQALIVSAKSDTANANEVLKCVIKVFVAYRRGGLPQRTCVEGLATEELFTNIVDRAKALGEVAIMAKQAGDREGAVRAARRAIHLVENVDSPEKLKEDPDYGPTLGVNTPSSRAPGRVRLLQEEREAVQTYLRFLRQDLKGRLKDYSQVRMGEILGVSAQLVGNALRRADVGPKLRDAVVDHLGVTHERFMKEFGALKPTAAE